MLSRHQAIEALCGVRDSQPQHLTHLGTVIGNMHKALHEARQALYNGDCTVALHAIASASAFGLGALEQHGGDARQQAPNN